MAAKVGRSNSGGLAAVLEEKVIVMAIELGRATWEGWQKYSD